MPSRSDRPFLVTIPTRPHDRFALPDGWELLDLGVEDLATRCRYGFVCYDPLRHDVIRWINTGPADTIAGQLHRAGCSELFTFGISNVWYRDLTPPAVATAA